MRALAVPFVFIAVLGGALADPHQPDEVRFSSVVRDHFDAVGVLPERGEPSSAPLVLRVNIVGDASDADIDKATEWLLAHANVALVRDPNGAPLFLTRHDLAATSGRGTLGATIPAGMAVEVRDPRVAPCVVAHEVLHFAGLRHVDERRNIMAPNCGRDSLERAHLAPWQLEELSRVRAIRATTPSGVHVWAERFIS